MSTTETAAPAATIVTIPASKLDTNTPVYAKISQGATNFQLVPVTLTERTFTCSLKDMKPEDKLVLTDSDTGEEIIVKRHEKIPQLVLEGTNRRVSFLEINEESKKQKEASDKLQKLLAEEAAVAEQRKQQMESMAVSRRKNNPSSTAGLSRLDKLKHRAALYAKRVDTQTNDLKKSINTYNEMVAGLETQGIRVIPGLEGAITFEEIPQDDSAPETASVESTDAETAEPAKA